MAGEHELWGDEDGLSWEDTEKIFRHAVPVEIVRGRRSVHVEYRRLRQGWRAISPDLPELDVRSHTLTDAGRLVRQTLEGWLDPQVVIVDQVVRDGSRAWEGPSADR
ncbi:hypothetical protein ACFOWE_06985 [Planomonospora corallina]|uniref:Uncharacterized protein n=1 Tax=Planomonospora corallina TaxID=1806052 RepID=A0ABV8I6I1_9ACTN